MTPADVPVVDPGEQVDVFEIEAGDCFDSLTLDEVTEVNGLSCDAEHLYEVYFAFDIEGETFPGEDTVIENSQEGCLAEFAAFVGIEYEDSFLDISYLYPTPKSWTLGDDREVLCMVVNLDDTPRVGSARGIGS